MGDEAAENQEMGVILEDVQEEAEEHAQDGDAAAAALGGLRLDAPPVFDAGGSTDAEHLSRSQKRRARRKRARDTARKLRRSSRLQAKEEAGFELPADKASHVQQAKFDYSGGEEELQEIAEACGTSLEGEGSGSGAMVVPPGEE